MSFNTTRRSYGEVAKPFCKVCYDAKCSVEEFTSHFVKDQPGPNGKVVCPTLLAQQCLICGIPGHTSSYCPDNSSVSSSASSASSIIQKEPPRYAQATDEIRYPPHSVRLHPIQKQQQQQQPPQQYRPAPRIVYASELSTIESTRARNEFPSLPIISSLRRFENDEPMLKRGLPAAASPVHSPAPQSPLKKLTKIKYNKKNNPFGALDNIDNDVGSDHETSSLPVPIVQKQEKKSSSSSFSSSWASIAAGSKSAVVAQPVAESKQQPQQLQQRARSRFSIVLPTAISTTTLPLLPPISFKPKQVSTFDLEKKKQVKKMWGDTDSEDDEEFLKRGLVKVGDETHSHY
jgi:hypothetical protein